MDEYPWAKMYLDLPRRSWLRRQIRAHGPGVAWVWTVCILEAKRADDGGRITDSGEPYSDADIADACAMPTDETRKIIGLLVEHGWLSVDADGCYRSVNHERRQNETRDDRRRRKTRERVERYRQRNADDSVTSGVTSGVTESVTSGVTGSVTDNAPVTPCNALEVEVEVEVEIPPSGGPGGADLAASETPTEKPAPKPKRTGLPDPPIELPEWVPSEEWAAFDETRRKGKARASWTTRAQKMAVKELGILRDAGNDPAAVLRQSVAAGWTGLFPVKNGGGPRQQNLVPVRSRYTSAEEWQS